jgi:predicted nucleic acid-binding protein
MLPDSAFWIDFTRQKTSKVVKQQIAPYLASRMTVLCEPVRFEVLRGERKNDRVKTEALLANVPLLRTPPALWQNAERYGQLCQDSGLTVPPLDLLIAAVSIHHGAEIVTFDAL